MVGVGDDFSPSPSSRPLLPVTNDEIAPPIGAVESGQEPGRGEPGQTELGTRPLKDRIGTRVISSRFIGTEFEIYFLLTW